MPDDGFARPIGVPRRHHLDRRSGVLAADGAAAGEADDLLSTPQLAGWLGLSTQFLEIARHRGFGPKFVRLSARRVRYKRSSVLEWLLERQHQATAEYSRTVDDPVEAEAKRRNRQPVARTLLLARWS